MNPQLSSTASRPESVRCDASKCVRDPAAQTILHGMSASSPDPHPERIPVATLSLGAGATLENLAREVRANGLVRALADCGCRLAWTAWRFTRQVSGDDAYERYIEHMQATHPDKVAMSRAQYFRFCQDQKWNRITRCC